MGNGHERVDFQVVMTLRLRMELCVDWQSGQVRQSPYTPQGKRMESLYPVLGLVLKEVVSKSMMGTM